MHCSLLDLPAELQLKIIKELLRDKDIETHNNGGNSDEPVQIHQELFNWSCTCSYFRNLLAPDIFKATMLVNDEESGSSLNALAKSPNNVHVKELHFIGSALGDAHSEEAEFSDTEGILPPSVDALLSDLQRFPSLERVSIKFDYTIESPEFAEGLDLLKEVETQEKVLEAEALEAWRALMSRTYFALARNQSPRFKHLEIRQLWKNVSTFSHAAFHDFLGHFEQFTLSIHGEDNGAGWKSNVTEEYPALMGKLDEYFFNHLANVTKLYIRAPEEGPLGLEGMNHAPLRLKAEQMPLLTTLRLDWIFASPELIDFLVGHKDTLEELTLRDCYASPEGPAENGIYWSQLFSALFSARPAQLRHFEVVITENYLPGQRNYGTEGDSQKDAILQQDPGRITFPYAFLDDKYGMCFYDEDESLESFLRGEDQRSWARLIELVEGNAKEAAKEGGSKSGKLQAQS
ncbi:hypothetical protein MMC22_010844 [Lobaria immixta]|nr:hypothetical protein [Lobaria immixta]